MPQEAYLYFGDSGFCPYGSKATPVIVDRVRQIVAVLLQRRCKLVVVACNAITAASIDFLRRHYTVPFIGMEPAVKPALMQTKTRAIGVLATEQTLRGALFRRTRATYGKGVEVIEQVGHGLVEKVEALDLESASTLALLETLIRPMLIRNIDVLVLGCTHYPFLEPSIRRILGDGVTILNPARAVARHAAETLKRLQLRRAETRPPEKSVFCTTGDRATLARVLATMQASRCEIESIAL